MNKEDSKTGILAEWEQWQDDPASGTYDEKMMFYLWLGKKRPELVCWQIDRGMDRWQIDRGMDRWQDVHGWLNVRTRPRT